MKYVIGVSQTQKKNKKRGTGEEERGGLDQGICTQRAHLYKLPHILGPPNESPLVLERTMPDWVTNWR
jgi:hypothetical protein